MLRGRLASELVWSAHIARYPRRTAIFREGEEPTALYGVLSGAVKVYQDVPNGRQSRLDLIEPDLLRYTEARALRNLAPTRHESP